MRRLWGGLVVLLLVTGCAVSRTGGAPEGSSAPDGPFQLAVPIELARVTSSAPPSTVGSPTPPASGVPSAPRVLPDQDGVLLTLEEPFLVITSLDEADVRLDQTTWSVTITLSRADGTVFSDWTETHVGEQVAMIAGDEVVSAPAIQAPIPGREISIAAQYTRDEAEDLLARITGR